MGHLHGHDLVVVLSGIGKVAAATTATILIEEFKVERIVCTGVAGGLGKNVNIGDAVVADSFMQHDMDASPIFPRCELPGYSTSTLSADKALKRELVQACQYVIAHLPSTLEASTIQAYGLHKPQVHTGLVVSGDRFVSTSAEAKQFQHDLPHALAVEMEGAAFAQVCYDYKVPFAAVRTISNKADDAATVDFTRFLAEVASHYSALIVDKYISAEV